MSAMIISLNGKITDGRTARISVESEAFLNGFAALETLRTYRKKPFRLEDHLARLYVSADVMGLASKWEFKRAQEEVLRVLEKSAWSETRVRVILGREELIIMAEKLIEKPEEMYKEGVKIVSYQGKRNAPHAKRVADTFCHMAKQHALSCSAYEALLVDPKTYVRECAYANVFWVDGNELYTTNKEILFGITRETVLELAGECHFEGIKYKSLLNADEVFITQTTSGILPVVQIDGQKIGNGKPGPLTKKLMKKFEKEVRKK